MILEVIEKNPACEEHLLRKLDGIIILQFSVSKADRRPILR